MSLRSSFSLNSNYPGKSFANIIEQTFAFGSRIQNDFCGPDVKSYSQLARKEYELVGGRDYFEKLVDENFKNEKLFYEVAAMFNSFKITDAGSNIGRMFKAGVDGYVPAEKKK